MLIAAISGLALGAALLFATAPSDAAPAAPVQHVHTDMATSGGCC
ncbi:hypothetical protein ABZW30_07720 [Kitasatospora sp. NPDC004669]